MTTWLERMGAGVMLRLLMLPLLLVGYIVYLVLTAERRKQTPTSDNQDAPQ